MYGKGGVKPKETQQKTKKPRTEIKENLEGPWKTKEPRKNQWELTAPQEILREVQKATENQWEKNKDYNCRRIWH